MSISLFVDWMRNCVSLFSNRVPDIPKRSLPDSHDDQISRSKLAVWKYAQLKSRIELDKIKLRTMNLGFPTQLWYIVVDYACEDPRIIDMVVRKNWIIYESMEWDPFDGYISLSACPAATGLSLPIRFDHWWLPPRNRCHYNAFVHDGFGGHTALEVILILPLTSDMGIEYENPGDQFGIAQMRKLLYAKLQKNSFFFSY